ncbi:MAG: hypothetical protein HY718_02280, partial [Planctomycetes bacterium]|nr:hypothetical protein [Planctomycetota bacterium]
MKRRTLLKGTAGSVLGWGSGAGPLIAGRAMAESMTQPAYPQARAVTRGPKHHFFGYYDKYPWDTTGRYLLAMEVDFIGRDPKAGEPLTVGLVDLKRDNQYMPLDT